MSTSENSKGNKTYNVHLSQQKIKDLNKDFIINKLKKELATLSKEVTIKFSKPIILYMLMKVNKIKN